MKREALADRIVTYSDALVAFSLVNGLAFLVALGEPDIRCSIAQISGITILGNLLFAAVVTLGLVALGRAERRFRANSSDEEGGGTGEEDEEIDRFLRGIHRTRFVLIWFFMAIVLAGIFGATRDERCLEAAAIAEPSSMAAVKAAVKAAVASGTNVGR